MAHAFGIRGQRGRLKVGYQTAAQVGPFTLSPGDSGWSFDAAVTATDAFWLAQEVDRTLELDIGEQKWIWRSVSLAVDGRRVTGTLTGRPERR